MLCIYKAWAMYQYRWMDGCYNVCVIYIYGLESKSEFQKSGRECVACMTDLSCISVRV